MLFTQLSGQPYQIDSPALEKKVKIISDPTADVSTASGYSA